MKRRREPRPEERKKDEAERADIKKIAHGEKTERQYDGPQFPQPLEKVMATENKELRSIMATNHLILLTQRIRYKLKEFGDLTDMTMLPAEAREALETSINTFRRNDVLSNHEIKSILKGEILGDVNDEVEDEIRYAAK